MLAGPPTILVRPQSQQVKAGGIASFYCTAEGAPPPQIHWRKNGKRVSRKFSRFALFRSETICIYIYIHEENEERNRIGRFSTPPPSFFLLPSRFTIFALPISRFRDYFTTGSRIAFKCLFFSTKFHARSTRKRAPAVASRRASLYRYRLCDLSTVGEHTARDCRILVVVSFRFFRAESIRLSDGSRLSIHVSFRVWRRNWKREEEEKKKKRYRARRFFFDFEGSKIGNRPSANGSYIRYTTYDF